MAVRRRPVTDRRREAEFVAVDLCVGRGKEVDAEAVGELDEIERDVGDLVEDVLRQLGIVAPGPRLLRSDAASGLPDNDTQLSLVVDLMGG